MHAVHQVDAFAHERGAIARQITQFPLGARWDEAGAHESMGQELSDPLRIFDVGLASGHGLDVRGIEQPDLKGAFEQVEDGFPILSCALDADMGAPAFGQPVGEAQQLARGRAKGLNLAHPRASLVACQLTDHHRALMDVNASAPLEDHLHALPPRPPPHPLA